MQNGLTDPDDVPEPPDEAVAKPGDLIILGEHRLLCGDSASADDVDRLLDGADIHLVNTDPPYNVKVEPRSNNAIFDRSPTGEVTMGRRGPAPTSTEILKLRGSPMVARERERSEVKPPSGKPRCPDHLDRKTKAAWKKLVPLLEAMGVLTRVDGNALARCCRLWSRRRKAEDFIDDHGDMYPLKDDAGQTACFQQWPQVAIAHKLALQLTRIEQEFGMTPSACARLHIPSDRRTKREGVLKYARCD